MPSTARNTRLIAKCLGATAMAALVIATPAMAGKGNPAPIVYAGQTGSNTSMQDRGYVQPQAPAGKAGKRIQFRYPDQPDVVYGEQGPQRIQNAQPLAFSSSAAAITTNAARKYASLEAAPATLEPSRHDPAITAGGFDAQAAAKAIELQRRSGDVTSTALQPLAASPQQSQLKPTGNEVNAVVYGEEYVGTPTASGEIYQHDNMTAAHPNLPLPSLVLVKNPATAQEVVVRVNDRGPFEENAGLQLSRKAASALNLAGQGRVVVEYLGEAPSLSPQASLSAPVQANLASFNPPVENDYELAGYSPVAPTPQQTFSNLSGQESYYVQLGSFSDIRNAEALQQTLGRSESVKIEHAYVNGADFFRVRVGPVMSQSEANVVRMRLAAQGFTDGNVVSK